MFLTRRFYITLIATVLIIGLGFAFPILFTIGKIIVYALALLVLVDILLLYHKKGITAARECSDRFSNGDRNKVKIKVESAYPFKVDTTIIDEAPAVFQRRDVEYRLAVGAHSGGEISYHLVPTERGVYGFGKIRVFAKTVLGFVERRFTQGEAKDVKVYPSYMMLNHYELLAMSNNLTELGIKRIRRVGNNTEFEQIKEYVKGDEYRTINWKASARRNQLMVNVYQDERSQQVYSVIDKGRVMQQAFEGMTLLDYSINAALVLSYIIVHREDKAGLITFADNFDTYVPPTKNPGQMQRIMEALYAQKTEFGETDFSNLCVNVNKHINKRSLLILYTNFSGMTALQRQLPYLRLLNRRHRLLVVFFEDAEMKEYVQSEKKTTEEYYQHVIAEKFIYEKRLIVSTLRQNGILSLLTTPSNLSVDVINKYLEMKQREILT